MHNSGKKGCLCSFYYYIQYIKYQYRYFIREGPKLQLGMERLLRSEQVSELFIGIWFLVESQRHLCDS